MKRDELLQTKDQIQKRLWREAGKSASGYVSLVHEKAESLRQRGLKLRYSRQSAGAAR